MKTWQILAIGVVATVAAVLLPFYQGIVAALAALLVLGAVGLGFIVRPHKTVFYVRTTSQELNVDGDFYVEHDHIAVRLEVTRLWLLFVPTFLAVAFLIVTATKGTLWKFDFLMVFDEYPLHWYLYSILSRALPVIVVGVLSVWLSERWVLRDVEACSARSLSIREGRVSFMFVVNGEYYGGIDFAGNLIRPAKLRTLVFYNPRKPDQNKIGMGLLFHRLTVVGRGLTDLDEETVSSRAILAHRPT